MIVIVGVVDVVAVNTGSVECSMAVIVVFVVVVYLVSTTTTTKYNQ